jgi:hypothetical protein
MEKRLTCTLNQVAWAEQIEATVRIELGAPRKDCATARCRHATGVRAAPLRGCCADNETHAEPRSVQKLGLKQPRGGSTSTLARFVRQTATYSTVTSVPGFAPKVSTQTSTRRFNSQRQPR